MLSVIFALLQVVFASALGNFLRICERTRLRVRISALRDLWTVRAGPTKCVLAAPSLLTVVLLAACGPLAAQTQSQQPADSVSEEPSSPQISPPLKGGRELEVWLAGAHIFSMDGSANDGRHIFDLGGRYGWVLTDLRGSGPLRGQFEYAVDVIPLFAIAQKNGTSYGFSFDAFSLNWNFQPRGHLVPYANVSGGGLITNLRVPPGSTTLNFTAEAGGGLHYLCGTNTWSIELGVFHISNGNLAQSNPAFNSIQIRIGFGRFVRPRKE